MVSDALVQEIRERADILEVISEFVQLKRSGKTYRGPCPLHGGEGPNFSVDPTRAIFKCFVCGEGGDVFSFLMKHLGLDFPSAVRQVAARVGVEVPDEGERREDPYAYLREVTAFAEEWFLERLEDDSAGRRAGEYLASRGIALEEAGRLGLGYAPDSWRDLRAAGLARGLSEESLLEAGLLATSDKAEEPYDRFRNRLMFAIRDLRDRPIAFGGRVLGEADDHTPKYINSPESPIFHKSRTLFGLCWARHAIRRDGHALIAEGYLDVLSLHVNGFHTAVAPLGTALTEEQAELLARYGKRAYLLYDSDAPGLRATFRAADALLAAGLHPMVVSFPAGEDPDSVVRAEGPAALGRYLEDAVDVLERKLQILERQGYLGTIEGRRRAVDGLLPTLRAVKDPALLDIYLNQAAERTGVRRETLVSEVARGRSTRRRVRGRLVGGTAGREPDEALPMAESSAERILTLLILRDPTLAEDARDAGLAEKHFRNSRLRAIYVALLERQETETEPLAGRLDEETATVWGELMGDDTEVVHPDIVFSETIRRMLHRELIDRLDQIDRELEIAAEGQARQLLVEKQRIARELREAGVSLSFLRRYSETAPSSGRER
jgi:DNA primase